MNSRDEGIFEDIARYWSAEMNNEVYLPDGGVDLPRGSLVVCPRNS